jgi:DNA-binding SARP family transcriptional activator
MLRLYITGGIELEHPGGRVVERALPGRQGRRALAYLTVARGRPVARDALAEVVWGDGLPPAWEAALHALVSRLRGVLQQAGVMGDQGLIGEGGAYTLRLPPETWIDLEAAAAGLDEALGALRRGEPLRDFGPAAVAAAIARRPFLPGEEGPWIQRQRERLRETLVRAQDCLVEVFLANGEAALAVAMAGETVELEPFRESGYRQLMRAYAAAGDRAQALRVYERCRRLLAEELGVDPAPETEAVYLALLS